MPLTKIDWPGMTTVWQYGTMSMTSHPSKRGFNHAKAQGVMTVIDLMQSDEEVSYEASGKMFYEHLIDYLVEYDVAGRALAMYAIDLGTVEGYSLERAVAVAEEAGLDHEGLKTFVLDDLTRHSATT